MNLLTKNIQGKVIHYTRMGLGLAALGRPGYINLNHADDLPAERTQEAMLLHAVSVLDAAWAAGIRYYDAARSYGLAETFLHHWLRIRDIAPEEITVGSKWGYTYTANWSVDAVQHEVKDHSLVTLRRQVGESSTLLSSWLKLYQIHSATQDSGVLSNSAVLDELARLRDGGLVMGLSVSGVAQSATIEQALDIKRGGTSLFGSVQATWNLYERSAGPLLQAAHDAGWLVIIKEGLANGRLTPRGAEKDPQLLQALASSSDSIDAPALAFVLQQPFVDIVLSGAATVSQVHSNIRAFDIAKLPDWLELQAEPSQYWNTRSHLKWN